MDKAVPKHTRLVLSCTSFVILIALWCILTYGGFVRPFFLSSPTDVFRAFHTLFFLQGFANDILASVVRITLGFLASAICAVPIGILMGRSRIADALLTPITSFIRYLPVPALLPFCILWLGIGETEKVMVVFIGVFFQLVLLIADIARQVPPDLVELSYAFGAGRRDTLLKVVVPYCLPQIHDSLRVTMGWAWGWVMLAELVGASSGIGFMILKSQRYLLNANMICGLLTVGVLGVITDAAFRVLGTLLFRWR